MMNLRGAPRKPFRASATRPRMARRRVARLTGLGACMYLEHMKRTNLVLDEHTLEEALRLSGERTYSKAVGRALTEFVRRVKAGRILQLAGSGLWEGDLAEMRDDRPRRPRRAAARGARRVSR